MANDRLNHLSKNSTTQKRDLMIDSGIEASGPRIYGLAVKDAFAVLTGAPSD